MPLTAQCIASAVLVYLRSSLVEGTDSDSHSSIYRSVYEVSGSNQDFATALYSELAKEDNSSNIFFSPLSIHFVLALAYVGAGGQTAQEMATGLRLPPNVDVIKTGFQQLLQGMNNNTDSVVLEIANKIYLAMNSSVKDEFNKVATENFFSEVQNVDFSLEAEIARIINEWVEKKTHDKIKNIISAQSLDSATKLVLVNAVYHKGTWKHFFAKSNTEILQFRVTSNKTRNVEMMHTRAHFALVKNNDIGADILELDFKDNTMSLVIMLPFDVDGLSELENRLSGTNLTTIFDSLRVYRRYIAVNLPKFKIEQTIQLKKYLKTLGMTNMFEENADFSPMSDSGPYVSEVLHKSFIDINEESTQASAVTDIYWAFVMSKMENNFYADHPFVFVLRCKISGAVIFMGRFVDPQS